MKILFVASVYRHLTAFHLPYMAYFQERGYEVYAAGVGNEDKEILQSMGVKCIDISFSRSPLSASNIQAYQQLKRLFIEQQFDLVHVHTPVAALLTRAAFRHRKHGKIVYTAHGFHFFKGAPLMNWLIYYPVEKVAARWTDHLITINEEDYQNALKILPKEKVSLVHGVGVEIMNDTLSTMEESTLKKELNIAEDAVVISYVAELNDNKNHQFLLRNWQRIKEKNPRYVLFMIGVGEKEQELKKYVEDTGLEGIQFLGYRRDVPKLLQITHIVALLSFREGLPKSIMEAMAASLPCVVTNTRGLRDLITDKENGFVVEHHADEQLIDAFEQLSDSSVREQIGTNAQRAVQPFLLTNVIEEYAAIYEQLLK